jgi:outer membrane receptor protein involved in Fe transport
MTSGLEARVMTMRRTTAMLLRAAVANVVLAGGTAAQQREPPKPDSSEVALLEEVVVTADRAATPIGTAVGAVTRLDAADLDVTRFSGVAEALRLVPGFTMVDRDGSGLDPQPIVRGFYGGGEAEYVVVLVDGKPLNALQSGIMTWELLPPLSIEAVEVVRGGSSSLYGDAAIGGVVNFISAGRAAPGVHLRALGAGNGLLRGGARLTGRLGGRTWAVEAAGLRSDGFRDHGARAAANAGLHVDIVTGERRTMSVSLRSTWRDLEQPGPLPATDLALDRSASDVFYRFDETDDRVHALDLDASTALGDAAELTARVTTEARRSTDTRTVALSPDFADTKERKLATDRIGGMAQVVWSAPGIPLRHRVVAGAEASVGRLTSDYYAVVAGARSDYAASDGARGAIDQSGEGSRRSGAGFAQVEVWPVSAVRISLGVRYDRLSDRYDARAPSAVDRLEATHSAASPRAGVSLRWLDTPEAVGSVYVTVGRSFKAPTPDQLFGQRTIPLPFPPFAATTSNPALVPQRGVSLEVGAYQGVAVAGASAGATLSVYQMDMRDELDFDVTTLRYVNLGRSRHRGVEAGVRLRGAGPLSGYATWTLQSATSRAGTNAGRFLKAIPRHGWKGGLTAALGPRIEAAVDLIRQSGAWLDDENTVPLPAFTRVDARVTVEVPGGRAFLEARNLLDGRYSTTGFPDPSGSGTMYYYPGAGRTLGTGIELRR